MAASRFYLDTNIIIAILEGSGGLNIAQRDIIAMIDMGESKAVTSELALAECLVKPLQDKNAAAVEIYLNFFKGNLNFAIIPVRRDILLAASRVRAEFRMKLPDAIHIATAILADCNTFVTNDLRMKMPVGITLKLWSELK